MRQVGKITIKPDHPWAKEANIDAEAAATAAAEKARKEVLERAAQRAAAEKAYRDSLKNYDKLEFKTQDLRDSIVASRTRRAELNAQVSEEWKRQEHYRTQLQDKCSHQMVIEHRTTWCDEYDSYHDGHYERKCIECFLVEESDYRVDERGYGRTSSHSKKYHKLEAAQIVLLRRTIDSKEYELEWDDLKW